MKYVHTNIISSNWQLLADFYIQVFDYANILRTPTLSLYCQQVGKEIFT